MLFGVRIFCCGLFDKKWAGKSDAYTVSFQCFFVLLSDFFEFFSRFPKKSRDEKW